MEKAECEVLLRYMVPNVTYDTNRSMDLRSYLVVFRLDSLQSSLLSSESPNTVASQRSIGASPTPNSQLLLPHAFPLILAQSPSYRRPSFASIYGVCACRPGPDVTSREDVRWV